MKKSVIAFHLESVSKQDIRDFLRDNQFDVELLEDMYDKGIYLDDVDVEVLKAAFNLDIPFGEIEDRFYGHFVSVSAFSKTHFENAVENIDNLDWPFNHIDWNKAGNQLLNEDYRAVNNYYFLVN